MPNDPPRRQGDIENERRLATLEEGRRRDEAVAREWRQRADRKFDLLFEKFDEVKGDMAKGLKEASDSFALGLKVVTDKQAETLETINVAKGGWMITGKIAALIAGLLSGLAAIVTGIVWAISHLRITP